MPRERINAEGLAFVVGEEKGLAQLLSEAEVRPLLESALAAGAALASLDGDEGNFSCAVGKAGTQFCSAGLSLEGEPVGQVTVSGDAAQKEWLQTMANLLAGLLNALLRNNLKRMLTTEMHTVVVNQAYEELLETNRQLALSEARYRDLAASLEEKVQQRTKELKSTYARLLQQEKMASVGQLAAGVAHEINNPMGFVTSNLNTLHKYLGRMADMLDFCRTSKNEEAIAQKWQALKLDFILSDTRDLIVQSLEGAGRVAKIVSDLKGFSHVDDLGETRVNVHDEIDLTLRVLSREMPPDTEIVREYGDIPPLRCKPGLLCQAFLNIFRNAFEACPRGLRLTISSTFSEETLHLQFADNGPGVPRDILPRIFDPFFTTKDVGRGTGMGLAVTYDVIIAHGGTIECRCPEAGGTVFAITLPLRETSHV